MDKKDKDINMESSVVSEPMVAAMPLTEIKAVDYSFGNRDFGYPHTLEELNAALDKAMLSATTPRNGYPLLNSITVLSKSIHG